MPDALSHEFGAFSYSTEATFGEAGAFATRLLTTGPIDVSGLRQDKIPVNPTRQRPSEGVPDVLGIFGGSFRVRLPLTGRGATGTSLATTDLATFMGHVIGTLNSVEVGAVITTGTSATQFTATGVNMPNGGMCRVGVNGDGRGNGQFYAVSGESSDVVTLLTAMSATPVPTTDTCFPALVVHPSETPGVFEIIQSLRCQLLTANRQFNCYGCYPMAYGIDQMHTGEVPHFWVEFGVSQFELANVTFPSATATNAKTPAVNAGGSFFLQQVGTATRQVYQVHQISFAPKHTGIGIRAPGATSPFQGIVACRRRPPASGDGHELRITVDSEQVGSEIWPGRFTSATRRDHGLFTGSAEDGQAWALYLANLKYVGEYPTQREHEGLNRVDLVFHAETGPTTTADLMMSPFRIAMG